MSLGNADDEDLGLVCLLLRLGGNCLVPLMEVMLMGV